MDMHGVATSTNRGAMRYRLLPMMEVHPSDNGGGEKVRFLTFSNERYLGNFDRDTGCRKKEFGPNFS